MVIPLALAARDVVHVQELGEAAARARAEASAWEEAWREQAGSLPPSGADDVTYFLPSGGTAGAAPRPDAQVVVRQAAAGATTTTTAQGWGYAASPAYLGRGVEGVVLVSLDPAAMREDLLPRLAAIGGVSLLLLAFAGLASWRLARQTVAPLTALTATAHAVADGDLAARAPQSDLPEIDQVGRALNRVTERVQELLADDRSVTAELAHQMRTPLTVLSVDIDGVTDPTVRERLRDDLDEVQRMVDEIIDTARRPVREGLTARSDAAAVVAERVRFWEVLAEDQGRPLQAQIDLGPLWVRLTEQDLTTAVDILLQNVFVHTPEGTPFRVSAVAAAAGAVEVTVADDGPGFSAGAPSGPGTSGLGLSIAARLAGASGGSMQVDTAHGTAVTLVLGPAA
jgi:signal transduction histidine kinase